MPWDWGSISSLFSEHTAPAGLQSSGMLSRDQVLHFFALCRQMLLHSAVMDHLRTIHAQVHYLEPVHVLMGGCHSPQAALSGLTRLWLMHAQV